MLRSLMDETESRQASHVVQRSTGLSKTRFVARPERQAAPHPDHIETLAKYFRSEAHTFLQVRREWPPIVVRPLGGVDIHWAALPSSPRSELRPRGARSGTEQGHHALPRSMGAKLMQSLQEKKSDEGLVVGRWHLTRCRGARDGENRSGDKDKPLVGRHWSAACRGPESQVQSRQQPRGSGTERQNKGTPRPVEVDPHENRSVCDEDDPVDQERCETF